MVDIGEPAPDFTLTADDRSEVSLSDFKGERNVVLAFYPFDFSPTCTEEFTGMRDRYEEFQALDTEIFGVSVDSHWAHKRFREELDLPFHLLSDFDRTASPRFDALFEDKGFNRRIIVIVDKEGRLAHREEFDLGTCPDADAILRKVKEING